MISRVHGFYCEYLCLAFNATADLFQMFGLERICGIIDRELWKLFRGLWQGFCTLVFIFVLVSACCTMLVGWLVLSDTQVTLR